MAVVYIALGANLGDKAAQLDEALRRVGEVARVTAISSYHDTAPEGYLEQDRFLNAAARVETGIGPTQFLALLLEIERSMGRVRSIPNGPRTIDLDILLWDDEILNEPGLQIPHPRMQERVFVLDPLVEIAPDVRHPALAVTVKELWRRVHSASA